MDCVKTIVRLFDRSIKVERDNTLNTCFDFDTNVLNIGYDKYDTEKFKAHMSECHQFNPSKAADDVWVVLHELGHFFTDEDVYDNHEAFQMAAIMRLAMGLTEKENYDYYNMPREWEATEWAIDWVRHHPLLVKVLNHFVKL